MRLAWTGGTRPRASRRFWSRRRTSRYNPGSMPIPVACAAARPARMAHFVPAVACCSLCPGWARPGRPGRWAGAAAPVQHQELVPGSVRSPGPLQCPAPARAALRHTPGSRCRARPPASRGCSCCCWPSIRHLPSTAGSRRCTAKCRTRPRLVAPIVAPLLVLFSGASYGSLFQQ